MFQFAKSDIHNKIRKKQIQYDKEMEDSIEFECQQKRVDQLILLKRKIYKCEWKYVFALVGVVAEGFVFGFDSTLLATLYSILPVSMVLIGAKASHDETQYREKISEQYSDLTNLTIEELMEKSKQYSDQAFNAYHRAMALRDSIRFLDSTIDQMIRYQRVLEASKEFFTNPYYLADSREEYEQLLEQRKVSGTHQEIETLLDDFVSEPVDYSTVSFDSSISTPISYTEKTKQLMKRYPKISK